MTRFQMEISGALGAYWIISAQEEMEKAVKYARENAIVEEDGAIRWKSNGAYLMDDFCEKLEYAGFPFSRKATQAAREAQDAAFLKRYRETNRGMDEATKAEARAAFGEGTTIVDVLSGEKITL
ncbi:MAG: hypothetical protein IJV41_02550 [Oscillospiraceae bacterium]|nr:hypothetical protein [Oscillospiraceae bacterium]